MILQKIKKIRGELNFVGSNLFTLAASTLGSFLSIMFIAPSEMGIINFYLLFQVYLAFLHLGVFNGLNRNLAYYKARGAHEHVQVLVNTTYTVALSVALISLLLGASLFTHSLIVDNSSTHLYSIIYLTILLILAPVINALDTTFRSGQQFSQLGNIKHVENVVYVSTCSWAPALLGAIGKMTCDLSKQVIGFILRWKKRPYHYTGIGDLKALSSLIKTGFPMLVAGYLWTVFQACDRTYIGIYMGSEKLGLYTLAGYITTILMSIPLSINALLYPKAAAKYSLSNKASDLYPFWKKSLLLYACILIPACTLLYYILPYLVTSFIPRYTGGLEAAKYTLLTCMTSIYFGPAVIFGTIRKNKLYLLILFISIAIFWTTCFLSQESLNDIEDIARIRFYISILILLFTTATTYKYVKP